MEIFNTLTNKKEPLEIKDNKINMFVCGPTVYDYSHIGHARTYVFFDVFAKYLKSKGFELTYLQNITDLDDKIIKRAKEEGTTPRELAEKFTKIYLEDMAALSIESSNIKYAKATDYIPQIIDQVKALKEKGFAYEIPGDGWYYDISKFKDYGKLSNRTAAQAEDSVSRIDESVEKKNKGDFCLWKFSKPGEPVWQTDIGDGRPGWHIEDTAITENEFGPHYDIHGGAQDLIFPHHEAEIAQQEALNGPPLARYWIHTGLLTVNGQKMSKSLGNFITIRDVLQKYTQGVIRLMVLSRTYGSPLDFNDTTLEEARSAFGRLFGIVALLNQVKKDKKFGEKDISNEIRRFKTEFYSELENDFNTQGALGILGKLVSLIYKEQEKESLNEKTIDEFLIFIAEIDSIFGIAPKENIPREIEELSYRREKLRKSGNFPEADKIRTQIEEMGYQVDDTAYGPLISEK